MTRQLDLIKSKYWLSFSIGYITLLLSFVHSRSFYPANEKTIELFKRKLQKSSEVRFWVYCTVIDISMVDTGFCQPEKNIYLANDKTIELF